MNANANRWTETLERRTLLSFVPVLPPTVMAAEFEFQTGPQALSFQFSEDVWASLDAEDLVLINKQSRMVIPSERISVNWDADTNTATFVLARLDTIILPDGEWQATLLADGISDGDGIAMDGDADEAPGGDYSFDFFFLMGDANHDRSVDLADYQILAGNFGQYDKTFGEGDLNYDNRVDLADFNILTQAFGNTVGQSQDASASSGLGKGEAARGESLAGELLA